MENNEEIWDLEIKPKARLLDINFREVWRYRDLLLLFVRRDFVAQYKQTVLGPLWHLIQPMVTASIFLLLFSRIARMPTDGVPPVLFYLSGITLWNYFSLCLTNTSNTFINNSAIFGKVYFPRLIMPLSVMISNLIRFGIQFLLLAAAIFYFHFHGYPFHFTWRLLYIFPLLAMLAFTSLGAGIIVSSLTTKYRDMGVALTFVVQLGMYATPVVYPLSYISGLTFGHLVSLNPLSPIMEAFRYSLFGSGTFTSADFLYSGGFMIVSMLVGLMLFNRVEKTFMDTV
jgi:lipopolysaccharide transport system permease protein